MAAGKNIFIGVAVAVVIIAVVTGLITLDSPARERMLRLDNRRVDDLEKITHATNLYWTRHKNLPVSLEELSHEPGINIHFLDPGTAQPYEYRVLGDSLYELCAQFERESVTGTDKTSASNFWSHGSGRQCFQLEAQDVKKPSDNL